MPYRPAPARRLALLATVSLAAAAALAPLAAQAQRPASAALQMQAVGIFALLGDTIQITLADAPTDTRLDRNVRESMDLKDLGLDQMALRGAREALSKAQPQAKLQLFRATAPVSLAEQRLIADGAQRGELPDWIIQAIGRHQLSHVMLITRHRGPALMRTDTGDGIGRGSVEGIGFYIDPIYEVENRLTGITMRGALGAYVDMRLTLMDVASAKVLAQHNIRDGLIYAARTDEQSLQPWNVLTPREKVEVLRRMVEENVARVVPVVLREAAGG